MVPWRIRLLLSLVSVVTAALICVVSLIVTEIVFDGYREGFRASEAAFAIGATLACSLVGWLFSAPLVLIVRSVRGWRFWIYWALGSCFGPLLMLALFALTFVPSGHGSNPHWSPPQLKGLIYLAATISILTTLLYLLLLRRIENRSNRRSFGSAEVRFAQDDSSHIGSE